MRRTSRLDVHGAVAEHLGEPRIRASRRPTPLRPSLAPPLPRSRKPARGPPSHIRGPRYRRYRANSCPCTGKASSEDWREGDHVTACLPVAGGWSNKARIACLPTSDGTQRLSCLSRPSPRSSSKRAARLPTSQQTPGSNTGMHGRDRGTLPLKPVAVGGEHCA